MVKTEQVVPKDQDDQECSANLKLKEIDKKKPNSISPSGSHIKRSKLDYEITPKPNEIIPPPIDFSANRNFITRHHLDDSQA